MRQYLKYKVGTNCSFIFSLLLNNVNPTDYNIFTMSSQVICHPDTLTDKENKWKL